LNAVNVIGKESASFHASSVSFWIFTKFVPSSSCPDAIYWGCGVHISNNKTLTFDLAPGDEIFKAVVWSEGMVVNAVQFHTKLGYLSPVL